MPVRLRKDFGMNKFDEDIRQAFALKAKCRVCDEIQYSEETLGNSASASVRSHAEKEFERHLRERGWSLDPFLCKRCRIKISLQTMEDMLDGDQLKGRELAKGSEKS